MKALYDSTGEVLVVTGGANGIGAAVARGFAASGGQSVVVDVVQADWEAERVQHLVADVGDRDQVCEVIAGAVTEHGRVDGLIASAAVQPRNTVLDTSEEEWRRTLAINLDGVVWATQAVLPSMIDQRRGSIVVFASGLANFGHAEAAAYAATKGALIPWAKSLAAEVAEHRVRVNTVFPGVIDTPQFRRANPTGGQREHWARTTGIGQPADIVGPLMFLLSDDATMTGSTLTRDRAFSQE
ncbi:SDR family NAD(P)-dependent oxidoreductase [Actinomadura sp. 9N407]|uniref:SDR family NAD(P)-dependent oxidoreductase n=1 Tax=Actinomadura sp. 9N407 TaxID=3375154 RepID=UPI0037AC760F